jgi:hypothetical protein
MRRHRGVFHCKIRRTPSASRSSAFHAQYAGKQFFKAITGCTMTNATLLSESGIVIVMAGGALAYKGERYFENQDTVERVAGFLLIAGLACIGASLGLVLDSPFP